MGLTLAVFFAIFMPVAFSIIFSWIYGQTKKEETEDGFILKTKFPKRLTLCSIVALILAVVLFVAGIILIYLFEKDFPFHSWIAFIFAMLFISSIPLFLVVISLRTYEIIREDGVLIKRLTSTKFVRYADMASYEYSCNQLIVYDREHKQLFFVGENRVGLKHLLKQLELKGIFKE